MNDIVILEDDPILAFDLQSAVEDAGGRVSAVYSSGEDAMEATKLKPRLAFIDLNLTDGPTGSAVAERLAEDGCRIVVLSGSEGVDSKLCAISHTFVSKPIPVDVLRELLKTSTPRAVA